MPSVYLARTRFLLLLTPLLWTANNVQAAQPAPSPVLPPPIPTGATQPFAESMTGSGLAIPPKMALSAAIDYALKNQPAVRAALARVTASEADVGIPRGKWLPSVGLTAQVLVGTANNTTASYLTAPFVPTPRVGGTAAVTGSTASWSPEPSTFAGLGVTQEVFDFGRISSEVAAFESLHVAEQRSAEAQSLDIRLGVEEAYFAVYSAKAVLAAAEDAYERARLHFDLALAGVASGLRPPIDKTRIQAELARFDILRIRDRGAVRTAQTLFAAAVGSPEPALDISDRPPAPQEMPSLDVAVQRAVQKEPALQAALTRIHAQEDTTRALFAQLRPDLLLAGTLNARAGGAQGSGNVPIPDGHGWVPNVPNWQVAIVLSWPLFDGTTWARGRASEQLEAVRREEAAVIQQELIAQLNTAYVAVIVARESLPHYQASVEAARANYAQADARFRSGLATSVELADAASLWVDAETGQALAEFELARSRAVFGRAIAEAL